MWLWVIAGKCRNFVVGDSDCNLPGKKEWVSPNQVLICWFWNFLDHVYFMVRLLVPISTYYCPSLHIRSGVKAAIFLLPLLGLTWVFGLLAVNQYTIIFQYLFAIFNSLQVNIIPLCNKNLSYRFFKRFKGKKCKMIKHLVEYRDVIGLETSHKQMRLRI